MVSLDTTPVLSVWLTHVVVFFLAFCEMWHPLKQIVMKRRNENIFLSLVIVSLFIGQRL